jgi:hypothetical protein
MTNVLEANYEFMKKSPVYLELKEKYKALKKQNQKLVQMMLDMRELCEDLKKHKHVSVEIKKEPEDTNKPEDINKPETRTNTPDVIVIQDDHDRESNEDVVEEVIEDEIVEEDVVEEPEDVVEEEEEEEVEESEEVIEEVVEEEVEEVIEEVVEEESEEEGVYEIEINGTRYYTTNEQTGIVYAILEEDEVGDQIGHFENSVLVLDA